MLGKEEIEFNLKALSGVMLNFEDRLCDEMQERIKEVKEYIEDLESREQKLIEKLEEDIKNKEELIKLEYEEYKEYYARTGGYPNKMKFNVFKLTGEKNKTDEILSILKGENHE